MFYRHRQHLRRWAGLWLFFWLFSVGTGIANACLAPESVAKAGMSSERSPFDSEAAKGAVALDSGHEHAGGTAHQHHAASDHHGSPDKATCKELCDRPGIPVLTFKSLLDDFQGDAALPPAVVQLMPETPAQLMPTWVHNPVDVPTLPMRIAYLRLAL